MRDSKNSKGGELLFDAIGGIDDRFIYEAETYVKVKRKLPLRKLAIAAVSFTLLFSLVLTLIVSNTSKSGEDSAGADIHGSVHEEAIKPSVTDEIKADSEADKENADISDKPKLTTLSDVFEEVRFEIMSFPSVDVERDSLFDGKAKIIWRYEGEDEYQVLPVDSHYENELINGLASSDICEEVDDDATIGCDVWICFGDGLVYSPYLRLTNGNIGYGELFDYEAEINPTETFAKLIKTIINDKLH
jgi:hypothetical protein